MTEFQTQDAEGEGKWQRIEEMRAFLERLEYKLPVYDVKMLWRLTVEFKSEL